MLKQPIDYKQIKWGQVWKLKDYPRQHFLVLGNCWLDDGTIWLMNLRTGDQVYGHKDAFVLAPRRINDFADEYVLFLHLGCFAYKGQDHVMDWFGWFFEGRNNQAALLFYIAAMRKNKDYLEYANRIINDLCLSQETDLDQEFCLSIPEVSEAIKFGRFKPCSDWHELVHRASLIAHEVLYEDKVRRINQRRLERQN